MSTEPVDYSAIITDLEAKRAALDATITAFRAAQASGALGQSGEVSANTFVPSASGGEVPVGAFLSKSIPEAAKLCLQIVKRKLTSREIADALQKGGIETTAKNFPSLVHSVLIRASRSGTGILKLDRSYWGLAEWYPSSMRTSVASEKRPYKLRHKRSRKIKAEPKPNTEAKSQAPAAVKKGKTVPERMWEAISDKELSAPEIASAVGIKANVAALLLGKLIATKWAEKTTTGKYRALKVA